MFREWGFLLGEIWVLILLAALLGLVAGWLIWGGAKAAGADDTALRDRLNRAQSELRDCQASRAHDAEELAALRASTAVAGALAADKAVAEPAATSTSPEGRRPVALDSARDGKPDDLKLIKGIGPQLEKLCNRLGFYHYDQIAAWTDEEVAWVDQNLEGFKGRVTRDEWVQQARDLAAGKPPRPMVDRG